MLINDLAKTVHENAVAHGWWEGERDISEIVALIHSEWSEALEEARAGRPLVYRLCADCIDGPCSVEPDTATACGFDAAKHKPEGIAVELIDGVIRILDFMGAEETDVSESETGEPTTFESLYTDVGKNADMTAGVPALVAFLHMHTSAFLAHAADVTNSDLYELLCAMSLALIWVHRQDIDPLALLLEKHEYNKGRPYKHGKNF